MIRLTLGAGEQVVIQDGQAKAVQTLDQVLVDLVGTVSDFDPIFPDPELELAKALVARWGGKITEHVPADDPDAIVPKGTKY